MNSSGMSAEGAIYGGAFRAVKEAAGAELAVMRGDG
jgi:hypothetical protein